jgi:hypothetical protein
MAATRQAVAHIRESWWFESMYTLQGKPNIHDTYAFYTSPRTLPVGNPRTWQPFTLTQWSWTDPTAPDKNGFRHNPQHADWLIRRFTTQFLSQHNPWSSRLKPSIYWWACYINLLGPYHQHVISTFNTCSQVPTYRSLIDTGEGYNIGGVGFPHHTPRSSQLMVLRFSLMVPPGLRLTFSI